jgi:hypothetical protein
MCSKMLSRRTQQTPGIMYVKLGQAADSGMHTSLFPPTDCRVTSQHVLLAVHCNTCHPHIHQYLTFEELVVK